MVDFYAMSMEKKVVIIAIVLLIAKFLFEYLNKLIQVKGFHKFSDGVLDWVNTGLSALFYAFLIMYFFLQAFKIPSGSMKNTLLIDDHLFVNKIVYGVRLPIPEFVEDNGLIKVGDNKYLNFEMKRYIPLRKIKRGDIVVFQFPFDKSKDFIKRCMGLPGDKIEIKDKVLYVNDEPLDEPYVRHADQNIYMNNDYLPDALKNRDNFGPFIVPADHYFMMGDNRDESYDSRFWGPLPKDYVKGKALVIYWPPNRLRLVK